MCALETKRTMTELLWGTLLTMLFLLHAGPRPASASRGLGAGARATEAAGRHRKRPQAVEARAGVEAQGGSLLGRRAAGQSVAEQDQACQCAAVPPKCGALSSWSKKWAARTAGSVLIVGLASRGR